MDKRSEGLDVLRCMAVVLIMFRHYYVSDITIQMGWIGVDLFFVLSGFLISGLLFKEYLATGSINPGLFLIRRGFKIYPVFWFVLCLHIAAMLYKGRPVYFSNILSELFFLQNFRENIMGISWTLAIEEHFYFFLIACAFLAVRKNLLANGKIVWRFCLSILLMCFLARVFLNIRLPFDESTHFFPTYLRIDALMFGVLISWFYHFRPKEYAAFLKKNRHWIIGLSLIGLSLPFLFTVEHSIMNTIGLSLLYLSFGGLVCFTEKTVLFKHRVFRPLVYIGRYSYSIYLVHLLCGPPISNFFRQHIFTMPELEWLNKTLYFLSNIVVGILISLFIEQPFLRLRERYFPKKNEKHKALPSTLKPERVI